MKALGGRAAEVEHELGAAWTRYHVGAQAARLAAGVVGSVLWAVLHGGVTDWTGLAPVATAAVWATLEQMRPQVPWALIRGRFGGQVPGPTAPVPPPTQGGATESVPPTTG